MAKKFDFKPDRPRSSLLSKLYLTQKQRRNLLKWVLYAAMLLVLSVVQDVLLCKVDILGATTELVPCGIFMICLLEGAENSCVFSLIAACLYLFSGSSAGNFVIVLITVIAFVACLVRQSYFQAGFGAAILCTFGAMLLFELGSFSIVAFFGQTYGGRVGVAVLTALYTALVAPVLYPVFQLIGKIGGETWKE